MTHQYSDDQQSIINAVEQALTGDILPVLMLRQKKQSERDLSTKANRRHYQSQDQNLPVYNLYFREKFKATSDHNDEMNWNTSRRLIQAQQIIDIACRYTSDLETRKTLQEICATESTK